MDDSEGIVMGPAVGPSGWCLAGAIAVIDTGAANSRPQRLINRPGVEMGDGLATMVTILRHRRTPSVECGTAERGNFGRVLISSAILHLLAVIAAYDHDRESRR